MNKFNKPTKTNSTKRAESTNSRNKEEKFGTRMIDANRNANKIICYNCNKSGHIAKDCWSKKKDQKAENANKVNCYINEISYSRKN